MRHQSALPRRLMIQHHPRTHNHKHHQLEALNVSYADYLKLDGMMLLTIGFLGLRCSMYRYHSGCTYTYLHIYIHIHELGRLAFSKESPTILYFSKNFDIAPLGFTPWVEDLSDTVSYYLDPQSMQNNGLYGCSSGFRAIILHTLGA